VVATMSANVLPSSRSVQFTTQSHQVTCGILHTLALLK